MIGGGLGAGTGLILTRPSFYRNHNRKIDERRNNYIQGEFNRKTNSLPMSYSDFQKRFPNQYKQLKDLGDLGSYNDQNPGDIGWFEAGGLEEKRYLPISSKDDYNNLMFDTKTGKYVTIDSEMLEPEPVRDVKSWVKFGY